MSNEQQWNWEEEYRSLLMAILTVGELTKGRPSGEDDKLLAAEGLLFKAFDLGCTAMNLFKSNVKCYDLPSYYHPVSAINVIARAAYEAFLIFNHVYVAPSSDAEAKLRYWLWKRNSLLEWKNDAEKSSEAARRVSVIEKDIIEATNIISENKFFCSLTNRQKRKRLEINRWKPGWARVAEEAGISKMYRMQLYPYLCGYAHSSYRSILQIQDAKNKAEREKLVIISIKFIMLSIAVFLTRYLTLWDINEDSLPEEQKAAVIIWTGVALNEYETTVEIVNLPD